MTPETATVPAAAPTAPVSTPAPAAPETPATVSATVDAAVKGDFAAFADAHTANRKGAPQAKVAAAPNPSEPAAPVTTEPAQQTQPPPISRRQQDANERIRQAVERATADLIAENARLKQQVQPRQAAQPQTQQPAPQPETPEWERYAALPGAPNQNDFDDYAKFTAALSLFIADTRYAEREAAGQARQTHDELTAAQRARVDTFTQQLDSARVADPEFVSKLTPEVRALKPFDALAPGEPSGPANVVAEQVFDSPIAPAVLLHFSQHPEALARLTSVPDSIKALPRAAQAKAHIQWIVREFGKLEATLDTAAPAAASAPAPAASPVTSAPPPVPALTRAGSTANPKDTALARGDFAAFQDADRAERIARRRAS